MRFTEQVHRELQQALREGDAALDATAGNGHDALAMARLVGSQGQLLAIDLQKPAIEATRQRLHAEAPKVPCQLLQGDHGRLLSELAAKSPASWRAITFNLGYLPGGDKSITTTADSTIIALNAAAELLAAGGLLCVTVYRGHPGGLAEADAVDSWMTSQNTAHWSIARHDADPATSRSRPPVLWIAGKLPGSST
ncbi:MAG: class I SAM-dependent methyltransferase [Opitutales bacterium]